MCVVLERLPLLHILQSKNLENIFVINETNVYIMLKSTMHMLMEQS